MKTEPTTLINSIRCNDLNSNMQLVNTNTDKPTNSLINTKKLSNFSINNGYDNIIRSNKSTTKSKISDHFRLAHDKIKKFSFFDNPEQTQPILKSSRTKERENKQRELKRINMNNDIELIYDSYLKNRIEYNIAEKLKEYVKEYNLDEYTTNNK